MFNPILFSGLSTMITKCSNAIVKDVEENKIKIILDNASPFCFDTEGVRDAMKKQASKHAHGKVVVEISKDTCKIANLVDKAKG